MIQNYLIFSHILWRLTETERVGKEFLIEAFLHVWTLFWGIDGTLGYFRELDERERKAALKWLRDHHAGSVLLAALYRSAQTTAREAQDQLGLRLRDLLRHLLRTQALDTSSAVLDEASSLCTQIYAQAPPKMTEMVQEIEAVVNFDTKDSFLGRLSAQYGYHKELCSFEKPLVYRQKTGGPTPVDCLTIGASSPSLTKGMATSMLNDWMRFQPGLDYYRIVSEGGGLLIHDVELGKASWVTNRNATVVEIEDLG